MLSNLGTDLDGPSGSPCVMKRASDSRRGGMKVKFAEQDAEESSPNEEEKVEEEGSVAEDTTGEDDRKTKARGSFWSSCKRWWKRSREEQKPKINLNDCDLTEEQLEELRVICKFSDRDLKYLRVKFLSVLEEGEKQFEPAFLYRFPEIQRSPLRAQLIKIFDLDRSGAIDFREFVRVLSVFSENGNRVDKLKYAFMLHDYDGDDRVSKLDLKLYLQDVTSVETSDIISERNKRSMEEEIAAKVPDSVSEKIEYTKKKLEELRNTIKARRKEEKGTKSRKAKASPKQESIEIEEEGKSIPASEKASPPALTNEKLRYEQRLKFLQKEQAIEAVVDNVFAESSSDQSYLTQEDFLRVVGHSDFQGKLVLSLLKR